MILCRNHDCDCHTPTPPLIPVGTLVAVKREIVREVFPVLGVVTAINSAEGYSPYKIQHGNCSMWFTRKEIEPVEIVRQGWGEDEDGNLELQGQACLTADTLPTLFEKEGDNAKV